MLVLKNYNHMHRQAAEKAIYHVHLMTPFAAFIHPAFLHYASHFFVCLIKRNSKLHELIKVLYGINSKVGFLSVC